MPKLSDYVLRAAVSTGGGERAARPGARGAAAAAAAPAPASAVATTAIAPFVARYRDPKTGLLLPEGSHPPERPHAHIQARREWRGLVRYCAATGAGAAAGAGTGAAAPPLPPDANFSSSDEGDEDQNRQTQLQRQREELVHPFEDPEAPWGAHYAALVQSVASGQRRRR
jgi:hypothetical protein